MTWYTHLTPEEKAIIDRYDALRTEFRDLQGDRNRIRNRAIQRGKYKKKNTQPQNSSCDIQKDSV